MVQNMNNDGNKPELDKDEKAEKKKPAMSVGVFPQRVPEKFQTGPGKLVRLFQQSQMPQTGHNFQSRSIYLFCYGFTHFGCERQ